MTAKEAKLFLIPNYPNYLISEDGHVWSCKRGGRWLKELSDKDGYLLVNLYNKEGAKKWWIHRIVALAFIGPCPKGLQARHLDDVKSNNHKDNIAYGTGFDNGKDRVRNGKASRGEKHSLAQPSRMGEANGNSILTEESVLEIRELASSKALSIRELSEKYGVSESAIYHIIKRRAWDNL